MEWEDGPENRAVLLVPKFRWGPLARWLQPRLKRPFVRLKLDDIGSFVWKRFDGRTTFDDIVKAMRDEFGEKAEPAEERLKKFLVLLMKSKFVELYQPASNV
jgi:hypothetical protein